MLEHVWLIPLMPLLAAIACGLAGRSLGERAGTLATAGMFTTLVLSLRYVFNDVPTLDAMGALPFRTSLFTWMDIGPYPINFGLMVDQVTAVMLLIVSLIGTLVFYYATSYMKGDPGYPRFFCFLSLFAFAMYVLILADNLLLLFVGWEGVGLCSYLLIGFWFKNSEFAAAGKKAFIVNRIGDFGLLIAMFLLLRYFGTLDFHTLKNGITPDIVSRAGEGIFTVVTICLLLAATGKSAQLPLFVWLPDAMAGPTPVSALIHAATMVTAGIYMVIRTNFLFAMAPTTMMIMAFIGAATALMAALIACTQNDLKKVLAYSTVSQLGYMFLGLGVGAWGAALFHVYTHAFFKGCLFLCAGSVIHSLHHEQDMRKMGGLKRKMPVTAAAYWISALAIAGVFPLSGFFSKDEILWSVVGQAAHGGGFEIASDKGTAWAVAWPLFHGALWITGWITAGLTSFYMLRSYYLTFEGETRMDAKKFKHVHESPPEMARPLIVLAFGAAVMGFLGLPGWLAPEHLTLMFQKYLAPALHSDLIANVLGRHAFEPSHSHFAEISFALLSLTVALGGWFVARKLYLKRGPAGDSIIAKLQPIYGRAAAKFSVDEIYGRVFVSNLYQLARDVKARDKAWIDGAIEKSIQFFRYVAEGLGRLQNGQIQGYALSMLIGLNLLLLFYLAA